MKIIRRISIISLILYFLFAFLYTDVITLNNEDTILGDICECKNNEVFILNNKTLFIIPISMITKIEDDQDNKITIGSIKSRSFEKINFNSYKNIQYIKPLTAAKLYSPRYRSKKYANYYDHRVNKMIYGNTARTLEKNVVSFSVYDLILFNFCAAISNKIEADVYLFSYVGSMLFMANAKYSLYSSNLFQLAIRSGFKYSDSESLSGGNHNYYSGFPQSLLITLGNVDYFITGNMSIEPVSREDSDEKKEFTPVTYHLGISLRLLKHMSISTEMFNSLPFPNHDGFEDFNRYTTVSGIRLFWNRNSLDLGLMDTFEKSDGYWPIITYTHHFYTQ